jgi:hypothetical protein
MAYFTVSKVVHLPTGRYYYSRHVTDNLMDGYLGSGIAWTNLLKTHPHAQFEHEYRVFCESSEVMIQLERQLIAAKMDCDPLCLNLMIGDASTTGSIQHSHESKRKMSVAQTGRKMSEAQKQKLSVINTGKHISSETRAKISAFQKGRISPYKRLPRSVEGNQKRSKTLCGRKLSVEHRHKIASSITHWHQARKES